MHAHSPEKFSPFPLSLPAQKECEFFWGLINQKMWSREKPGCWDYFLTKFCQQLVVHAPTLSTKFQPFLPLPSCKITIFHVLRALYVWSPGKQGSRDPILINFCQPLAFRTYNLSTKFQPFPPSLSCTTRISNMLRVCI